jgi:hypothetical protein
MAWIYRAVEQQNGSWTCRHGLREYDSHPTVQAALAHLAELAGVAEPFTLYIHPLRGPARPVSGLPDSVRLAGLGQ